MENLNEQDQMLQNQESNVLEAKLQRRSFLQYAGAGAAALALTAVGCRKDRGSQPNFNGVTLDFKDDFGVLNYAYALEQLEAAFYIKVGTNLSIFTDATEKAYFQDIQAHEIAHREFFKNALGSASIGNLSVDFSSINFTDRSSVLAAAKSFEDLGVAAYNGAGVRINDSKYLVIAGQIVSVEARHAAAIRDMISNGSFADLNELQASGLGASAANGLDGALTPDKVLAIAGKYIKTPINVINL